ncbi:MAG: HepT-like ribonuclease domain-containing protein [Syntrophobacteraceae bacterium]
MVIHEYFGVDLQIIWETIQHDLPPLAPLLRRIVAENS